jgi:hypothetical protein
VICNLQKGVLGSPLCSCSPRRYQLPAFLFVAAAWLAICVAARAEATYTITSYPAGLADLPCDAFKKTRRVKDADRHYRCRGCSIVSLHFKDTKETRIIESKCDKK